MYYSGTFFGRTLHSAFTARLVVSDLYPVIFATLLGGHPPFVVKFLWIKSIGLSKKAPLCCLWRSPEIKSEQESIPVGCVQTSAVASTPGSIPLDTEPSLWILYPVPRYPTPPLDIQGAPKRTRDQAPGRNLGPEIPHPLTQWTDRHSWKHNLPLWSVMRPRVGVQDADCGKEEQTFAQEKRTRWH